MPSAVNLRVTCPYFMFPGDTVWTENIEGFRQFPVGTRLVLAEARVNFFQEDQPVPLSAPWAYRFVSDSQLAPELRNPRVVYHTGDPEGLEKPCFSVGFGPFWWTDLTEIDQPVAALTLIVKRAEPLGFDLAMWLNDAEGRRSERAPWVNEGQALRVYGLLEGIPAIGTPTPPPDTPIPPVAAPPLNDPVQEATIPLPTLADGPTEGMDVWAAWRDGRLNGIEAAARYCDSIPSPVIAGLIRLKVAR
mgnify:CR=1 FL=1